MEMAMHSDVLNRFASLSKQEQQKIINGARGINSHDAMRSYVENIFNNGMQ